MRTATTADGLTIWCVELDKAKADEQANAIRETGRRVRIARRIVRAFGAEVFGYVVLVGDKWGLPPGKRPVVT